MSEFKITMENPHAYQTRGRAKAEIVYISPDSDIHKPVIAKITEEDSTFLLSYTLQGMNHSGGGESVYDLIPIPKKQKYKVILCFHNNRHYTLVCDEEKNHREFITMNAYVRDLTDWIEYTP